MIYTKASIRTAYQFALSLGLSDEQAIAAVADSYCIDDQLVCEALEEQPA